ncbi:hypothetical protein [Paraglaciecola sp. MB-3u-78]|jgi:hypothetical protein|uniref:hypothetical protein n=1 Tax=Paraglaciecola sp. MB-3u-78 TaxID=2058332 RepID=UPI000C33AAA4|nr:hypothetical protein [Paraglaciecola sp. MB-3u-78]PKG96970.1 hypothetical protein CXF95_21930 [Paraglaciecola sp. MB-3u-78]
MDDKVIQEEPPLVLVQTWYELLLNGEDKQSRRHAEKMLMGAFGTQEAVANYLKKHNIIE